MVAVVSFSRQRLDSSYSSPASGTEQSAALAEHTLAVAVDAAVNNSAAVESAVVVVHSSSPSRSSHSVVNPQAIPAARGSRTFSHSVV